MSGVVDPGGSREGIVTPRTVADVIHTPQTIAGEAGEGQEECTPVRLVSHQNLRVLSQARSLLLSSHSPLSLSSWRI